MASARQTTFRSGDNCVMAISRELLRVHLSNSGAIPVASSVAAQFAETPCRLRRGWGSEIVRSGEFFVGVSRHTESMNETTTFPVTKTDEEWRKQLTPQQYAVLRNHATEAP